MDYTIVNDELYHHGVKGMKWGVRRYQNKDGSLKPAGEKRYGSSRAAAMKAKTKSAIKLEKAKTKNAIKLEKAKAKTAKELAKSQKKSGEEANAPKKKSIKDMSDDELAKAIRRSQMEQQYRQLNPEQVSRGKKLATIVLNDVLKPAAIDAGKKYLSKLVDDAFADPNSLKALESKAKKLELQKKIKDLQNPKESVEDAVKRMQNERKLKTLLDLDAKDAAEARKQQGQYDAYNKTAETSTADKSGQYRSGHKSKTASSESTNSSYQRLLPGSKEDSKVYSGTVMGEGTSSSKTKAKSEAGSKWWKSSDVQDATWWSAEPSKAANTEQARLGQSYVQQYLLHD